LIAHAQEVAPPEAVAVPEEAVSDQTLEAVPEEAPVEETPSEVIIEAPAVSTELIPLTETSTLVSPTSTVEAAPTEVVVPRTEPDLNFLQVNYSLDGQSWFELQKVNVNNWPNFTVELPVSSWQDLRKVQISVEGIPSTIQDLPQVSLDGMLVQAQYELPPLFGGEEEKAEEVSELNAPIISANPSSTKERSFRADESPFFDLDINEVVSSTGSSTPEADQPLEGDPEPVSFLKRFFGGKALAQEAPDLPAMPTRANPHVGQILGPDGKATDIRPLFLTVGNQLRVSIPEPKNGLMPGRYHLRTWILKNGVIYYREQDFTWGVIAVNFNKTVYAVNDKATVAFGVVNDQGHTQCDADIEAQLLSPGGTKYFFSTDNDSITRSPECGPITVTLKPDYFAQTPVVEEGLYKLHVAAVTENGLREVDEQFSVEKAPDFDVERIAPVRIYPLAAYDVHLKVKANKHFNGKIVELVPGDFQVTSNGSLQSIREQTSISWEVDLKPGDELDLAYTFDAPDISPELWKLGPLSIGHWQETRQWQIAADVVANNGRLFYGDATNVGTMRLRTLTSPFTFGTETSTPATSASHIAHIVAKAAPVRDEMMIGHLKVDGRLDVIRGVNGSDVGSDFSAQWNNPGTTVAQTCNSNTEANCTRAFDLAYEQLSGRSVVFYADTTNQKLYYCVWNGSSWSPVSNCTPTNGTNDITLTSNGRPVFVSAKAMARSNEILVGVGVDVAGVMEVEAFIWNGNGTSTSNFVVATDSTDASTGGLEHGNSFDVEWEDGTGQAMVIYATGAATEVKYKLFSGSSWSSEQDGFNTNTNGAVTHTINADRDGRSNRIAVVLNGSASDLSAGIWKATGTAGWAEFSAAIGETTLESADVGLNITDVVWENATSSPTSTALVFAMNQSANTPDIEYSLIECNNTNGCSATAIDTNIPVVSSDDGGFLRLTASPNSRDIMGLFSNIDRDLFAQRWSGSAWEVAASAELAGGDMSPGTSEAAIPGQGFQAAFSYIPYKHWSMNWRWTTDLSNNSPSSWLNSENVAPTSTVTSTTQLRLRFNVAEKAGMGQTDSRKKLQYTTSTPDATSTVWTDVDGQGGSAIWKYINGPGTDDTNVAATQLSSSTVAGPFVENGTSTSAYDHTALAIAELDYAISSNNAPSGTYYFRMYDNDQQSAVYRLQPSGLTPCASNSSCTYPSVTVTASNSAPAVSAVSLNSGNALVLTPDSTTNFTINFTVTDTNGCSDVFTGGGVTTTVYRSGVAAGPNCTANDRSCYRVSTVTTSSCSGGNSANATTTVSIQYFGDATDASSSFASEDWLAHVAARDAANATGSATSTHVELSTLLALDIASTSIAYGQMAAGANTGSSNREVPIRNAGNSTTTIKVSGTDLLQSVTAFLQGTALEQGVQRNTFYDAVNSKYWAFLFNDDLINYYNSGDGISWSSVGSMTGGVNFSVWPVESSSTVYLAFNDNTIVDFNSNIVVERGVLGSSSISWVASSSVASSTDFFNHNVSLTRGTDDRLWLAFVNSAGGGNALMTKRSAAGSISSWGSSTVVFSDSNFGVAIRNYSVAPLSASGDVMFSFIWSDPANTELDVVSTVRYFNSSSSMSGLMSIEDGPTTPGFIGPSLVTGAASSSHLAWLNLSDGHIKSARYNAGSWTLADLGTSTASDVSLSIDQTNSDDLYIFHTSGTDGLYVKKGVSPYGSAQWGSSSKIVNRTDIDQLGTTFRDGNASFPILMDLLNSNETHFYAYSSSSPTSTSDSIVPGSQHYASSTFTFGGLEKVLSDIATAVTGFSIPAPTSTASVRGSIYWGIEVPSGKSSGVYLGTNTFTAQWSQ
jgi:hypothetical protein